MSSRIGTCFVTLPSATSASNAQTKLTLFSSDAWAPAVPSSPGAGRLKTTTAQIYTTHRHGCIVSSPTKGVLAYQFGISLLRFIPRLRPEYEGGKCYLSSSGLFVRASAQVCCENTFTYR